MRKIGVSPRVDVRSSAEQTGGAYVPARKPGAVYGGENGEVACDQYHRYLVMPTR